MWEKILNLYFWVKLFLGGGKFILGKSYILIAYIFVLGATFALGGFSVWANLCMGNLKTFILR